MFAALRAKQPGVPLRALLIYDLTRKAARLAGMLFFGLSTRGLGNIPRTGPLLIASNHESYLDPPLFGGAVSVRHLDYIARGGLFKSRLLGAVIRNLSAIPIKEETGDLGAIKEVLKRLELGRCVLIFPEGSRTHDGGLQEFKRGVALLVKKAGCPVVPAAITGAYENWPRTRKFPAPWRRRVRIRFGEPLVMEGTDGEAFLARIRSEIERLIEAEKRPTP